MSPKQTMMLSYEDAVCTIDNTECWSASEHFADVSKTIPMPKGAEKDMMKPMATETSRINKSSQKHQL